MMSRLLLLMLVGCMSCQANSEDNSWASCKEGLPKSFTALNDKNNYYWQFDKSSSQSVRFIEGGKFVYEDAEAVPSYRNLTKLIVEGIEVISYSIVDERLGIDTGVMYMVNVNGGMISLDGFDEGSLDEFLLACKS